eukprot:1147489-Pelagomonas_calceolata.AAC.1
MQFSSVLNSWSSFLKPAVFPGIHGSRHDQVKEEAFGNVLTNPEDVELTIRRAQKAVLNPGAQNVPCFKLPWLPACHGPASPPTDKPAKDFLNYNFDGNPKDEAASNELQFSKNLVAA